MEGKTDEVVFKVGDVFRVTDDVFRDDDKRVEMAYFAPGGRLMSCAPLIKMEGGRRVLSIYGGSAFDPQYVGRVIASPWKLDKAVEAVSLREERFAGRHAEDEEGRLLARDEALKEELKRRWGEEVVCEVGGEMDEAF